MTDQKIIVSQAYRDGLISDMEKQITALRSDLDIAVEALIKYLDHYTTLKGDSTSSNFSEMVFPAKEALSRLQTVKK